jgi:DNA-binding CsgD family transcriptional regulator
MRSTLAGVPQFLRYLSTFPSPRNVVDSLFRGPLAQVGARSGNLWELREGTGSLVSLGAFASTPEEIDRYGIVPLDVDMAVTNAVRDRRVIVDEANVFGQTYLDAIDDALWQGLIDRVQGVSLVSAPICHAGVAVGALAFITDRHWSTVNAGDDLVDALTAALGLWITHSRAGLEHAAPSVSREWSLAFTPRQREVLRRVEDGEHTAQIAAGLEVSESSVKADLQGAMRALRTSDRREAADRARMLGLL